MDDARKREDQVESIDDTSSDLYEAVQSLTVGIEDVTFEGRRIETESRTFERTVIQIHGDGDTGFGEDVTPSIEAHEQLRKDGLALPTGAQTVRSFISALDTESVLSEQTALRANDNNLRWAIESAALDLALKQSGQTLATVLDRTYEPMTFVASLQLGDPPRMQPLYRLLDTVPDLGFKIDVPGAPSNELLSKLSATDTIRVLDLKGQYDSNVGAPADPELYRRLLEMFPNVLIEDPTVTDATRGILEEYTDRISWDAPITSIESIRELPWEPTALNIKPCRSGSLKSLCRILEYAFKHDIGLYGGGMFELDAGRSHSQAFASLFYPDSPNDLAPTAYHRFEIGDSLPESPLAPPATPSGIGWYRG